MKIETFSAEETYKIGEQMGREAKAGDVLCLLGDLGVGQGFRPRISRSITTAG